MSRDRKGMTALKSNAEGGERGYGREGQEKAR